MGVTVYLVTKNVPFFHPYMLVLKTLLIRSPEETCQNVLKRAKIYINELGGSLIMIDLLH